MASHSRFARFHRVGTDGVPERQCSICQQWFAFTHNNFHTNSNGYLHGQCKACLKARTRAWYEVNKEKAKLRERKRYLKKGKPTTHYKRKRLLTHRGIAKAIGNGTSPAQVLQRIFVGWE